MSDTKQVKVDNWGIYFLQRLKHFFNRTDYCDLTLQFQDNAQLKVHRLVLNACTEYFEYLERMCEMYEDCLIMPDDLQADVVVPIVNFMYTGQLEYKPELLEKLYQTAQIMNMTVLTKLLDAQRNPNQDVPKQHTSPSYSQSYRSKRSYTKAFESSSNQGNQKKVYIPTKKATYMKTDSPVKASPGPSFVSKPVSNTQTIKRRMTPKIGPTRYEIPEELESDFDDSFSNISYESRPLMIHPQVKQSSNKSEYRVFEENSGSKKIADFKRMILDPSSCTSTIDVVECKKINNKNETLFEDDSYVNEYNDVFDNQSVEEPVKDTNQLFDEILDSDGPKVTFETKELKEGSNIDHAKIISEVLKKYPHLVKSNKSIKLKIVNASSKQNSDSKTITRSRTVSSPYNSAREIRVKNENTDQGFTYETDVIDSKEAARLIAMGAENIAGPWICLICGTPGKALHFTSYYKYRRHLVEVHREKPIVTICEHCGLKSNKRNYMLHHMYTKHGIPPPPAYKFPKCNQCQYVALTEAFLIKHKLSHSESKNMNCNVCFASFKTPSLLLQHMQTTGHKISAERKPNLQCIYCLKVFLREGNLYAHLKTYHKQEARNDDIIDNSDEEEGHKIIVPQKVLPIKYEPEFNEEDSNETQYQIHQKSDDNIQILMKSPKTKQKILNQDLDAVNKNVPKQKLKNVLPNSRIEFIQEEEVDTESQPINTMNNNVVMINDNEFIIKDHTDENNANPSGVYIDPQVTTHEQDSSSTRLVPTTSEDFAVASTQQQQQIIQQPKMILKKAGNISQPIQIVVSNEEEYKALMSSNSSIIFDDTSATIDLNNPQSNDMMIIQQDYPLNVSEAVQTDNSNIVVVYSHPVDDQNKQYLMNAHYGQPQLITSEALGAQFVQSSAVITQNFETITTSAPIVSGPVLVQQPIESWENNIQQNIVDPTVQINTNSLQQITTEQTQMLSDISLDNAQTNVVDTMAELSDIQLVSQEQPAIISSEDTCVQPDVHQTEVIESTVIVGSNEHQHIQESNNLTLTEIENNGILQEESVHENIEQTEVLLTSDSEKISEIEHISNVEQTLNNSDQSNLGILESADNITETLVQGDQQEISISDANESTIEISNTINPEVSNTEVQNILFQGEEQELSHIQEVSEISIETGVDSEKTDQIQNLTSEWSEEEEDKTASDNLTNENMEVSNLDTANTSNENDKAEVEESIENIQQEMEKQMMEASKISQNQELAEDGACMDDTNDKESSLQSDTENMTGTVANGKHVVLQQKISSLLNDWEENDSQDENEDQQNVDDEAGHISESAVEPEQQECVKSATGAGDPTKNENIKSLVSDWDDDDDDEKVN